MSDRATRQFAVLVPSALLVVLTIGCAGALPATNPPTPSPTAVATATPTLTAAPTPSPTASPSPTVAPSPTADTAAPEELIGRWQTTLENGELVFLTLFAHAYQIDRGDAVGAGRIDVTGDEIRFSQSSLCAALGTYGWSITDGVLTFDTMQEGCPGRLQVLGPTTYTKP